MGEIKICSNQNKKPANRYEKQLECVVCKQTFSESYIAYASDNGECPECGGKLELLSAKQSEELHWYLIRKMYDGM